MSGQRVPKAFFKRFRMSMWTVAEPYKKGSTLSLDRQTTNQNRNKIEDEQWWLWGSVVILTMALTAGLASFALLQVRGDSFYEIHIRQSVRGLVGLVLLFDLYSLYQQTQLHAVRRRLIERDNLFRIITENAVDMIALVTAAGDRIYISPSYSRVLGYSNEELLAAPSMEQVHPDDREKVLRAAEYAKKWGQGEKIEYRMRHKNGEWLTFESTASAVSDSASGAVSLVIVNRDVTDRKRAEQQLQHSAFHDALTDLPNRALFLDRVTRALNRSRQKPECKFAVLLVDLDDFKKFNESLGHSIGDQLLIEIGRRLTAALRRTDTVSHSSSAQPEVNAGLARLGGDEFTVLIEDIHGPSDAVRVAKRIDKAFSESPILVGEHKVFTSLSVGVAFSSPAVATAEDLLRDASLAMYRAKKSGRGKCEVFDAEMHAVAIRKLNTENQLRDAIENQEFRVHYQPVIRLATRAVAGFEALIRWQKPNQGLIPPGQFIEIAEQTGLIVAMNRWLRLEACRAVKRWQLRFPLLSPLTLSLNVTAAELAYPRLVEEISEALAATDLRGNNLQLEIVETIAMSEKERVEEALRQARALGLRIAIDDFGKGYSSFSRLRYFPIDTLKIDRAFVSRMDSDKNNQAIVRAIIALARNFDLSVVGEGTETAEEIGELVALGCDYAQGYFFSRPFDEEAATAFLASKLSEEKSRAAAIAKS